jgi:hypothetical protein
MKKYNKSLIQKIKKNLPLSEKLKQKDICFDNLDGEELILRIKDSDIYHIVFIKNFNNAWGLRLQDYPRRVLAVFEKVTVDQAEELRKNDIEFMDMNGNIYLNLTDIYIFIAGKRSKNTTEESLSAPIKKYSSKIFRFAGVKLIYALLTDPALDSNSSGELLNATFRELAAAAEISLGSVAGIIPEMIKEGYIVEDNGNRLLMNRKELFRKWLTGFHEYRARWNVVNLESSDPQWWKNVNLEKTEIFWGGEPAASILTNGFLLPEITTLYTKELINDFILQYDLRKVDKGGNVQLIALPPGRKSTTKKVCVNSLLVYSDLIYSGDDRNREAANKIYELYLKTIIEPY